MRGFLVPALVLLDNLEALVDCLLVFLTREKILGVLKPGFEVFRVSLQLREEFLLLGREF